jgi:hypothetical protein
LYNVFFISLRRYKNIAVEDDKQIQALVASQARKKKGESVIRKEQP